MKSPEITPDYSSDEQDPMDAPVHAIDPVRAYLNKIGKRPLLSAEDEVELSKQIEAGVYAEQLLAEDENFDVDRPPATQRMRDLGEIALQGSQAKNQMLEANLRLVVSLAKRHTGRGVPLLDLIQEGNLGLIRAVEKFDYKKGFKFSTYATWWIRQSITQSMGDQGRTIRLPVHITEKVNKLYSTKQKLFLKLGREATNEEIATEMKITVDKVADLFRYSKDPLSLDLQIGTGEDAPISDFIAEDGEVNPTEVAGIHRLLHEDMSAILDGQLTEQEAAVIRMRFGMDGYEAMTLDQIGNEFDVTRERIRQIQVEALKKLRTGEHGENLESYRRTLY